MLRLILSAGPENGVTEVRARTSGECVQGIGHGSCFNEGKKRPFDSFDSTAGMFIFVVFLSFV